MNALCVGGEPQARLQQCHLITAISYKRFTMPSPLAQSPRRFIFLRHEPRLPCDSVLCRHVCESPAPVSECVPFVCGVMMKCLMHHSSVWVAPQHNCTVLLQCTLHTGLTTNTRCCLLPHVTQQRGEHQNCLNILVNNETTHPVDILHPVYSHGRSQNQKNRRCAHLVCSDFL